MALPERKAEIVRALVAAAPDHAVQRLSEALAETPSDGALGAVRALVEAESNDRRRRNAVFSTVFPLFGGPVDAGRPSFPPRALGALWAGLKEAEPDIVAALALPDDADPDEANPRDLFEMQEALCQRAAAGLRTCDIPDFARAAEACAETPGGAEGLAACLDLSLVVRRAVSRLPDWLAQRNAETAAAARLAYKDAVTIADDATPRFFHMLSAHMAQPWMVLRIICSVMDKPNERYLHDSELAGFAEAVLDDVDVALKAIAGFRGGDGPDAARTAARRCERAVQQIMDVEASVDLNRETGWGLRLHKQRAALAASVEARLREAEKAALEALPVQSGRGRRGPRLEAPPAPLTVDQAMTLLTFSDALHSAANYGGFSAARNRMIEKVGEYHDLYVEDALGALRHDADPGLVRAYLDCAADMARLLRGEKAGDIIRRRAHAALASDVAAA